MSQRRLEKVNHQILIQVAELLLLRSEDPRLKAVGVTRVETSPDLRKAKVFWSVLGDEAKRTTVDKALTRAAGFIRSNLAGTLGLRTVPELTFVFDKNLEYAQKLNQVLNELKPQGTDSAANPLGNIATNADEEDEADEEDYDDDFDDEEDYDDGDYDHDDDEGQGLNALAGPFSGGRK
jgi:ribosome-binding factor A